MVPRKRLSLPFGLLLVFFIISLHACSGGGGGGGGVTGETPPFEGFEDSAHADATAEAFNHWDADVPPEVPTTCAKCHNTAGFLDFLGVDGSAERQVDFPVAIDPDADNSLDCDVCHNDRTFTWDTVVFPSGVEISVPGRWSLCYECHQGRTWTGTVDEEIADAAPPDDDTVDTDLSFQNIHYFAAAATRWGGQVMGGYQYVGQVYDIRFAHVEGTDVCTSCHNPHTLEIFLDECSRCHTNVQSEADLANIRMLGSVRDYDGDGDTNEGITFELATLREKILQAIQAYGNEVSGTPIVYDENTYPYFFIDTNGNGVVDPGENTFSNGYNAWTARLLRAAYNLQYSLKDPGCAVHNAKYVIQLLYDSITDLNSVLTPGNQVDMTNAVRVDAGHFDGSAEAFRHWDADDPPVVPASCSRCHSAEGLPLFVSTGTTTAQPLPNGFQCSNCHPAIPNFAVQLTVPDVTFPSGAVIDSGNNTTNLCMTCHQGRESKLDVDEAIANAAPPDEDTVDTDLSFLNIHYFAAGATRYGTEAMGGYEYDGKRYDGFFPHVTDFNDCSSCHTVHGQDVRIGECGQCHAGVTTLADLVNIRMPGSTEDYNGNGNVTEGITFEIDGLRDLLLPAMQAYATAHPVADDIVYDENTYPYFFIDTNGNGIVDPGENIFPNGYKTWTARLLKAAYNLQYSLKDPGCSAHNAKYVIELLYDSIEDVGGDVSGLTRNDFGHFDATSEAFRHWDEDGAVPGTCARCHASPAGFDAYLATFTDPTDSFPVTYGLTCETCHTGEDFAGGAPRKFVSQVVFPSGVAIQNNPLDPDGSFLCMTCHQGREAKATIDEAIAEGDLSFKNVHYLGAGATLYGSAAVVGYQYDGKTYNGKFDHFTPTAARCFFCHEVTEERHKFLPRLQDSCKLCHSETVGDDIETIRLNRLTDYDGDGNNTEKLKDEIQTLAADLLLEIQAHANTVVGVPIVYDPDAYPYFFIDTNGNGVVDPGENIFPNQYNAWNAPLLKAAHNYQHSQKETGSWAHNTDYIAQLLIDSIEDLGGDVSGYNRP